MNLVPHTNWALDGNGNALPDTAVEVRQNGSLATIYADALGTTALTNPFNADGASDDNPARYQFYAAPGRYDVVAGADPTDAPYPIDLIDGRNQRHVSLAQFSPIADGVSDDVTALTAFFDYCHDNQIKGYIPAGSYRLSHYRRRDMTNSAYIECHPNATIKGIATKQIVAGDDSVTTATVTFPIGNDGVYVVYISGGSETVWTEGTQYTASGANIDWGGGTSPHGALATGDSLRIVSADPMLEFGSGTDFTGRFVWRGGTIDTSERGFAPAKGSGSGLSVQDFDSYLVEGVTFYGSPDFETALANGVSDTGMSHISCNNGLVSNCKFVGHADLGYYPSGGADSGGADDGIGATVRDCLFYRCKVGMSAKRAAQEVFVVNNVFLECNSGATYFTASGLPGGRGAVIGNRFIRCGRRGVDVRRGDNVDVVNNTFVDMGRELDGVTPITGTIAIYLSGLGGGQVTGNRMVYEDYASPTGDIGIRLVEDTIGTTKYCENITISGNEIGAFETACRETGSGNSNIVWRENNLNAASTTKMNVPGVRRWHYRQSNVEFNGIGSVPFAGDWTPEITFAGLTEGVDYTLSAYIVQDGTYRRFDDMVQVTFKVQVDVTHNLPTSTAQLRMIGLTYFALNDSGVTYGGSITDWRNIDLQAGASQVSAEVLFDEDYIRFRQFTFGAEGDYTELRDIQSGVAKTIYIEGSLLYRVEPEAQN